MNENATAGKQPAKGLFITAGSATLFADDPKWVSVIDPVAFLSRLVSLRSVVMDHALSEAHVPVCPDAWGPTDDGFVFATRDETLVVTSTCFWICWRVGRSSYLCATHPQKIADLAAAVSGMTDEPIYMGGEPGRLKKSVREFFENGVRRPIERAQSIG